MKRLLAAITITITATLTIATPTSAAPLSGSATWGAAWGVDWVTPHKWKGTVDDTLSDGYCVELWTIDRDDNRRNRIARSCGAPATGYAYGGHYEDERGVRMYRVHPTTGQIVGWLTIVWPGT